MSRELPKDLKNALEAVKSLVEIYRQRQVVLNSALDKISKERGGALAGREPELVEFTVINDDLSRVAIDVMTAVWPERSPLAWITKEERQKINEWNTAQDKIVWKKQQAAGVPHKSYLTEGQPYYGAIGGSLTYEITHTSLGTILVVKHHSGDKLDLTDYDNW